VRVWELRNPGEPGWTTAAVPEVLDLESVPGSGIDLEDDLAGGVNDLAGVVDYRSPQSGGITPDRHHLITDITLERFIEEER